MEKRPLPQRTPPTTGAPGPRGGAPGPRQECFIISALIGESNVAIDPAIGGYGVADIYLGEFSPQGVERETY